MITSRSETTCYFLLLYVDHLGDVTTYMSQKAEIGMYKQALSSKGLIVVFFVFLFFLIQNEILA